MSNSVAIYTSHVAQNLPFVHPYEQASHNGELVHAVEADVLARDQVTELGAVLTGDAKGRESDEEITTFDSNGLAIQDLAVALAALETYEEKPNSPSFDSVSVIETQS